MPDRAPERNNLLDYEELKALAKDLGRPVSTLIALASVNDPFYVAPHRQRDAEWFAEIWNRFELGTGIHVRRIHYRIVSQSPPVQMPDGTEYENTTACWKALGDASRDSRYLGLVPIEAFEDRRNAEPIINLVTGTAAEIGVANDDLGDAWLPEEMPVLPALMLTAPAPEQRYHVELWAEKTTMNDVLEPLAERYGVNLITGMGELSLTACHLFLERVEASGRPARILYVSDFDPAGDNMPVAVARKIEFELARRGLDHDIQVRPVALTEKQCRRYRLPRTPIKDTDKRAARFEERFGEGATELDALEALHPGELRRVLIKEIRRYYDHDLEDATEETAEEVRADLDEINEQVHVGCEAAVEGLREEYADIVARLERWRERAEAVWRGIRERLATQAPDPDDIDWPEADEGDEDDDPLFDSTRDYVDQIDRYKAHQDKPTERRPRNGGAT
jgi:hypothetical protein